MHDDYGPRVSYLLVLKMKHWRMMLPTMMHIPQQRHREPLELIHPTIHLVDGRVTLKNLMFKYKLQKKNAKKIMKGRSCSLFSMCYCKVIILPGFDLEPPFYFLILIFQHTLYIAYERVVMIQVK